MQYIHIFESRYPRLPLYDEYDMDNMIRMKEQIANDKNGNMRDINRCKLDIGIPNRGRMEVLIPRNTVLPVTKKKLICLKDSYQSTMHISIYQGNDSMAKNNVELYRLEVKLGYHYCSTFWLVLNISNEGVLSERVVDCETGNDLECKDILSLSTEGNLKGQQNVADQQKRKIRNRFLALDTIRNRLRKWGFSLIEEGASEEDQKIILHNFGRLRNENLSTSLITEIYSQYTKISERLV